MSDQELVLKHLKAARREQNEKHGDHQHSVAEWLLILENQLHKAKDAHYRHGDGASMYRVLQVAASAVCCLEQNADYYPEPCPSSNA